MQRQTMLTNLPEPPMDTRNANNDNTTADSQLVDDILKGMGDQTSMYSRQMDGEIVVPQENTLPPNPEQMVQLQQHFQQQQQYEQPPPVQYMPPVIEQKPIVSWISYLKTAVWFFVFFMILSAPFIKQLLLKITYFNIEGELSLVGLIVKAVLGSVLFTAVQAFL